jgi:hypothetical protein
MRRHERIDGGRPPVAREFFGREFVLGSLRCATRRSPRAPNINSQRERRCCTVPAMLCSNMRIAGTSLIGVGGLSDVVVSTDISWPSCLSGERLAAMMGPLTGSGKSSRSCRLSLLANQCVPPSRRFVNSHPPLPHADAPVWFAVGIAFAALEHCLPILDHYRVMRAAAASVLRGFRLGRGRGVGRPHPTTLSRALFAPRAIRRTGRHHGHPECFLLQPGEQGLHKAWISLADRSSQRLQESADARPQ